MRLKLIKGAPPKLPPSLSCRPTPWGGLLEASGRLKTPSLRLLYVRCHSGLIFYQFSIPTWCQLGLQNRPHIHETSMARCPPKLSSSLDRFGIDLGNQLRPLALGPPEVTLLGSLGLRVPSGGLWVGYRGVYFYIYIYIYSILYIYIYIIA